MQIAKMALHHGFNQLTAGMTQININKGAGQHAKQRAHDKVKGANWQKTASEIQTGKRKKRHQSDQQHEAEAVVLQHALQSNVPVAILEKFLQRLTGDR